MTASSALAALPAGAPAGKPVWFHGAADSGQWRIETIKGVVGTALAPARYLRIDDKGADAACAWSLHAVVSNLRYTTAPERREMQAKQAGLGRADSLVAVLIPISKSPTWWALAQDERRAIYERSNHTPIGLDYLPGIARQLHHGRDLGAEFDFLTWFEFAARESDAFRDLLGRLRATEEWSYVERETEIWLSRTK